MKKMIFLNLFTNNGLWKTVNLLHLPIVVVMEPINGIYIQNYSSDKTTVRIYLTFNELFFFTIVWTIYLEALYVAYTFWEVMRLYGNVSSVFIYLSTQLFSCRNFITENHKWLSSCNITLFKNCTCGKSFKKLTLRPKYRGLKNNVRKISPFKLHSYDETFHHSCTTTCSFHNTVTNQTTSLSITIEK